MLTSRRYAPALLVLAFLVVPAAAHAEPAASVDAADAPPDWSVGVGFGFTLFPMGASPGLGGLGALGTAPTFAVLTERRLTRDLWLAFQGNASYSRASWDDGTSDASSESLGVGASIGVRYVFNPEASFEVSGLASLGYSFGTSAAGDADESSAHAAFAQVGFAVERELTDGVLLRLSTTLAEAAFSVATQRSGDQEATSDHTSASVVLHPSLELRYAF